MPKLIDNLPVEKRQTILHTLDKLFALENTARNYHEDSEEYKKILDTLSTEAQLFDEITHIVTKGKDAHALLLQALAGLDQEMSKALDECIADNPRLSMIVNALHFNQSLENSILMAKERISENQMYTQLTEEKQKHAHNFIISLKALKPMIDHLISQKAAAQEDLRNATTLAEVEDIENEIEIEDQAILGAYKKLVSFPNDDEELAAVLMKHLDKNPHIKEMITAFNFHESLIDDIMNARISVGGYSSLRP